CKIGPAMGPLQHFPVCTLERTFVCFQADKERFLSVSCHEVCPDRRLSGRGQRRLSGARIGGDITGGGSQENVLLAKPGEGFAKVRAVALTELGGNLLASQRLLAVADGFEDGVVHIIEEPGYSALFCGRDET